MHKMKLQAWVYALIMWLSWMTPTTFVFAQEIVEPDFEALNRTFKKKYLSFGALLQTVGDFQIDRTFAGNNGFNISNFRLMMKGELDGFGYSFATNFVTSPTLLDAKMYYRISDHVSIDAGRFKSPFSKEFLTYAGGIDFVNRAQVVSAMAPGRQIGVQIHGTTADRLLGFAAGVFNGNGFSPNNNDDNNFLFVGRVIFFPLIRKEDAGLLEIGFNAGASDDSNVNLGSGFIPDFSGKRYLIGGDFRYTNARMLFSGEMIYSGLEFDSGNENDVIGFHFTSGYMLNSKNQLLLRIDSFDPKELGDDTHLLILGYNYWPTQATEVQVNYIVNTKRPELNSHQILLNAQFSF